MTTLDRLHRLDDRLTEFARGDYVNKAALFPSGITVDDRLRLTSASFRPSSALERLRSKLSKQTAGLVPLGPRDRLARSARVGRRVKSVIQKAFKSFGDSLE